MQKIGIAILVVLGAMLIMLATGFFALIGAVHDVLREFGKVWGVIAKDTYTELQDIWKS